MRIVAGALLVFVSVCYSHFMYAADFQLIPARFDQLPGWKKGNLQAPFKAFQLSCREMLNRKQHPLPIQVKPQIGANLDWSPVCNKALHLPANTSAQTIKNYFMQSFKPYLILDTQPAMPSLFTGYFLPEISASWTKTKFFNVPIYGLPRNPKQTLPDRAGIVRGEIKSFTPVIAWTNSWIDLFFAQVQGSVILRFANGQSQLIGYAGKNNYNYVSIAKVLLKEKAFTRDEISMQSLHTWLTQHPREVQRVLNTDPSYVFFKLLPTNMPLGTEQVPLTPYHSLAIDLNYIPLGAPLWLDTLLPSLNNHPRPWQALMIAQDSGGAIKGVVRGDLFFGTGKHAAWLAGKMKSPGNYWILLPRTAER